MTTATATTAFDMQAAPLRIGSVTLKVRDASRSRDFYQTILGLDIISVEPARTVLGVEGRPLVILDGDPALAPRDPRQAGLFHIAFLLPDRADLGRWLAHATGAGVSLQGASDHIVSEALYLSDPEGNGIEIYADRPVEEWQAESGQVRMATEPLNLQAVLQSAGTTRWQGFPAAGGIGHVHQQVGDIEAADRFYRDILGFAISARYPGASFYGSGGYHHQLAGNVWHSRGAGPRQAGLAGLDRIEIVAREPEFLDAITSRARNADIPISTGANGATLRDPWGAVVALVS